MKSRCVVVLGIQGSGTSAVAGILHHLGISMGKRTTSGGVSVNSKGHFEDIQMRRWLNNTEKNESNIDIHNENVFQYLKDRRSEEKMWGIKEPRLCSKLDLIHRHLGDYRVICTERSPIACARSHAIKSENDDITAIYAMQHTLKECRNFMLEYMKPQALWVNFNNLTDRPEFYVRRIANFSFQGKEQPSEEQIQKAISFVDPSMNHKREQSCGLL